MKIRSSLTNLGVKITVDRAGKSQPLMPAKDADQANPRRSYVYAHMDDAGNIFYIGKGEGRRAWSTDRHPLWHRYVEKHLGGKYRIRILQDNLSMQEAEESEADWIAQCSAGLVNWQNMARDTDFQELDRFHKLRNANRSLIQEAKVYEKRDLKEAANMYVQAIKAIAKYASITYERGLVGKLLKEEADDIGKPGEIEALDRLTMCLIKLGRVTEAANHANRYFALYRRDLHLSAAQRIGRRVEKALARAGEGTIRIRATDRRV